MDAIKPYAKAVAGGLLAGLLIFMNVAPEGVEAGEWAWVAANFLGVATGVWAIPNKPGAGDAKRR